MLRTLRFNFSFKLYSHPLKPISQSSTVFKTLLSILALTLISCESERKAKQQADSDESDFYQGEKAQLNLGDLSNELSQAETDFLRSFQNEPIAWQLWNHQVLEKAQKAQTPILAVAGDGILRQSREIIKTLGTESDLRDLLTQDFICTICDTHAHPELQILSYHLAHEVKQQPAPLNFIWLTPQGDPITWMPFSLDFKDTNNGNERRLKNLLKNAVAMVNDIWKNGSQYAIENSRRNNQDRNLRLTFSNSESFGIYLTTRKEAFRSGTRQLSTLYRSDTKTLEFSGGLAPTHSLNLLALGSLSKDLTAEVNQTCLEASTELAEELLNQSLRDQLDGSFFYSKRTPDWSLPFFSKTLASQTQVIQSLFQVGVLTNNRSLIDEALMTLRTLNTWFESSIAYQSPMNDPDLSGRFLWDQQQLSKILSPDDLSFALRAFGIKKSGNIPLEMDPAGLLSKLNSLRSPYSVVELSESFGISQAEAIERLQNIKNKLKTHREGSLQFFHEGQLTCSDYAMMVRCFITAATITQTPDDLKVAKTAAEQLLSIYYDGESGLHRIAKRVPAKAHDYGNVVVALSELYQLTLDENYIEFAKKILDEGLERLSTSTGLIGESSMKNSLIPTEIISPFMIFGESSLGLMDHAALTIKAITGSRDYDSFRQKAKSLILTSSRNLKTPVANLDFLTTCAYGDSPLIAVLSGDHHSQSGQELLTQLNSRKYLSFLFVRKQSGSSVFKELSKIPSLPNQPSVTFIQKDVILGTAKTALEVEEMLQDLLFSRK